MPRLRVRAVLYAGPLNIKCEPYQPTVASSFSILTTKRHVAESEPASKREDKVLGLHAFLGPTFSLRAASLAVFAAKTSI